MSTQGISLIDDESDEAVKVIRIINISGSAIALIIELVIGTMMFTKLRNANNGTKSEKNKTSNTLNYLFISSFILAVLISTYNLTSSIISLIIEWQRKMWLPAVRNLCYWFLLLTLLGTLVMRLHVTFGHSAFKITIKTVYVFITIFVLEFLICILWGIGAIFDSNGDFDTGGTIREVSVILFSSLYIIGSAFAVSLFVVKLSKIARLQVASQGTLPVSPQDIELNTRQQQMLDVSARYILLFFIAALSSILYVVLLNTISRKLGGFFFGIEFCVNLLCLYLQFAFAAEHYRKCCGCLDPCCRKMVSGRAKQLIHKESMEVNVRTKSMEMSADTKGPKDTGNSQE